MAYDIYLSPPDMGDDELKYIHEAFSTNWIAPVGVNLDRFEKAIIEHTGSKSCVALTSGTAAIHLSLILLGINRGDEVLAPTLTFAATINPIIQLGATPILIDSEMDTWNMDPVLMEKTIQDRIEKGKKPKAIIVVHLYGMPAKMNEINAIATKYEIPIIEDAAEALGSKYQEKALGTLSQLGVFSFNGNKILTTSAGGALISDDEKMISRARSLAGCARELIPHYNYLEVGYNYRMSNILAGIGIGQMNVLQQRVKARRDNFFYYKNALKDVAEISFLEEPNKDFYSNYWLTSILVDENNGSNFSREKIRLALLNNRIESRPIWTPLHTVKIYQHLPYYGNDISEHIFKIGLCLPSGSALTIEEKNRICKIIQQVG